MRAVRCRHVLGDRGVPAAPMRTGVAGDALMAETPRPWCGDPRFDLLADQGMRHRVVVVVELDVVIEAGDPCPFEFGVLESGARQRPQRRPVERVEPAAARALELLERSVVEFAEQLPDRGIQLGQREKRRWRSRARIQRSTSSTPASTLALSRGLRGRAGSTAQP